jgi:hypothetical protein
MDMESIDSFHGDTTQIITAAANLKCLVCKSHLDFIGVG